VAPDAGVSGDGASGACRPGWSGTIDRLQLKFQQTHRGTQRPKTTKGAAFTLLPFELPYASNNDGKTSSRVLISSMGSTSVSK